MLIMCSPDLRDSHLIAELLHVSVRIPFEHAPFERCANATKWHGESHGGIARDVHSLTFKDEGGHNLLKMMVRQASNQV
jgi:hypothetical protein